MRKLTLIPFILALSLFQACNFLSKPDYVGEFKDGYAVAKNLGKWGLVNEDLEPVVPFEYDSILPPAEGRTAVQILFCYSVRK
jgi:WG containing repeat